MTRAQRIRYVFNSLTFAILAVSAGAGEVSQVALEQPFTDIKQLEVGQGITVSLKSEAVTSAALNQAVRQIEVPLSVAQSVILEVERFDILSPSVEFYINGHHNPDMVAPDVALYHGSVAGEDNSRAFVSFSGSGLVNGYVDIPGQDRYYIATSAESFRSGQPVVTVHSDINNWSFAEVGDWCGTESLEPIYDALPPESAPVEPEMTPNAAGARFALVGIEGDSAFVSILGNVTAAQEYTIQLLGVISDIYARDVNVKLVLGRLGVWPGGGEPFTADDLDGFRDWALDNYDFDEYNLVHLWSSLPSNPWSGLAWVGGTCGTYGLGIEARLRGSFPLPVTWPDFGVFDIFLVAHEMGHNFGSGHTFGYDPPIDQCYVIGPGPAPARGTIMSYCSNHPGTNLNVDLRFHGRVQEVIENQVYYGGCHFFDCNDNNVDDTQDILLGTSFDTNGNGIPDECEDCNGNEILDPADITGGAPDVNGNGILDECEADCNDNDIPDQWDIATEGSTDLNYNDMPDECEPDCNSNSTADYIEITSALLIGIDIDLDRNLIPDACQDCNGNVTPDWIDLGRQNNLFAGQPGNAVREYLGASGVPIQNYRNSALLNNPYDIICGADRKLYIASHGNDRVLRMDPVTMAWEDLVTTGTGGLDGPTALALREGDGALFVASSLNNCVLRFNASDGSFVDSFVTPGSGGLYMPYGLALGPNGNLFVGGEDNTVREYSGTSGAYVQEFVSAGSGGLSSPRGMLFNPNGNLLVASYSNGAILEYDGSSGDFVGRFNDLFGLETVWGMTIGPSGNLFAATTGENLPPGPWIIEYDIQTGQSYHRPFITADDWLVAPTGLAFLPPSPDDCNGNNLPDSCDIASAYSLDLDDNGVPDECEIYDVDEDGVADSVDNCPLAANSLQEDSDSDLVGDSCDVCDGHDDNADSDWDGIPDGCDICDRYVDYLDADADGVPDGCDRCQGFDDAFDTDGDGVPDDCDACAGHPDSLDADLDGIPDACDTCHACEGSVVLDHVDGLAGGDTLATHTPIVFNIRLRTNNPGKQLWWFEHSFRLYTQDGAVWAPVVIDSADIDWTQQYGYADPSFEFTPDGTPGPTVDTVTIEGWSLGESNGLDENFDEVAITIATSFEDDQDGKTICLDLASETWNWRWLDSYPRLLSPLWDGPHCFNIVRVGCCTGVTGNVDGDIGEIIDIGDLTALISYLFIPPNPEPVCMAEANVDGDEGGIIDIGDLTAIISYLFIPPNPAPADCQ